MPANGKNRIYILDIIRGVLIIYVVYYHLMYDLSELLGKDIPYLYSEWFSTIRDIMSGSLIFISGISCNFSRNNIKRGIKTLAVAMVMTLVTAVVIPSQIILFGILHLLGTMMLIYGAAEWLGTKVSAGSKSGAGRGVMYIRGAAAAVCLLLFAFFHDVYSGYVQVFSIHIALPDALYGSFPMYLAGFGGNYFSADYYPLLPWGMLFLAGAMSGGIFLSDKLPKALYRSMCRPLEFIGRHTMVIYLAHQPLLLALFFIIDKIKELFAA